MDGLVDYIGGRIAGLPGVRLTRTHVITGAPFEGSRWRLRSLSAGQRARLAPPAAPAGPRRCGPPAPPPRPPAPPPPPAPEPPPPTGNTSRS